MLGFLEQLKTQHSDDESLKALNEIESALLEKKYGLVWEQHTEQVDEMMKNNIPVFVEDKEKEIVSDPVLPYNFLLEGDNLHSLKLLEKTHAGKIDVIYIDPPYNTGSKDFIYDDRFIAKEDGYRHSKWLSFMEARLKIAKKLLSTNGLIFISIDDNEVAQLKLLCDDIFGANNFRGQIARSTGTPTGQGNSILSNEIDYIIVYAVEDAAVFNGLPFDEGSAKIYNLKDEFGKYLIRPLRKTGGEDKREDRPSMYYPISAPDGTTIYPIAPSGYESRWRCQKNTYLNLLEEHRIEWKKDKTGWKVYQKFYLEGRTKQPGNLWTGIEGNKKATMTIKKIFEENVFSFPKPVELITRILQIAGNQNSIVLDFFAGSGTTAHAVLELNIADRGNRKFILCTNNENKICEKITYERIKRVINGYSNIKGIPANLKYYKTDFVERYPQEDSLSDLLLEHIKEMVQLENAINIDDKHIIILDEDDADDILTDNLADNIQIYIASDVLLSNEQKELLQKKRITVNNIPDYYFNFELKEVGE